MKKFITAAFALAGILAPVCHTATPDVLIGKWQITTENGEPASSVYNAFEKTYAPDGKFSVTESRLRSRENGVRVYDINEVQKGEWQIINDSTIVEKCEWGNKGDVVIRFTLNPDSTIVEKFAYNSNIDKVYVQELKPIDKEIGTRLIKDSGKVKYYTTYNEIPGLGSFGPTDGLVYFIGDTRYSDFKEFKAALPEASKIEMFSVLKDGSAYEMLTDEEKAAGKSGIFIVTLKE